MYFHIIASNKRKNNYILEILVDGSKLMENQES